MNNNDIVTTMPLRELQQFDLRHCVEPLVPCGQVSVRASSVPNVSTQIAPWPANHRRTAVVTVALHDTGVRKTQSL